MRNSYLLFLLVPSFFLISCVTPGGIKQEESTPQTQISTENKEVEKVSLNDVSLADAIQSNEEIKIEQEKLKGRIEKLEFELNNKINEINKKLDQMIGANTNEQPEQNIQSEHSATNVEQVLNTEKVDNSVEQEGLPNIEKIPTQMEAEKVTEELKVVEDLSQLSLDERYKIAKKLEHEKKHDEAEKYYTSIIGSPSKWYDERARFFLGSMYYNMGKYKDAIIVLQDFVEKYPNSKNVPSSILTQAESFISLKQTKNGEIFLKDVVTRFPKTKEAEKAKTRLKKI